MHKKKRYIVGYINDNNAIGIAIASHRIKFDGKRSAPITYGGRLHAYQRLVDIGMDWDTLKECGGWFLLEEAAAQRLCNEAGVEFKP